MHHVKSEHCKDDDDDDLTDDDRKNEHMMNHPNLGHLHHHAGPYQHHHVMGYGGVKEEMRSHSKNQTGSDCGIPIPASKPKIWSLADTAACKTPPPLIQSQHGAWMPNPYATHHPYQHPSAPGTHNPMMMSGGNNLSGTGHHLTPIGMTMSGINSNNGNVHQVQLAPSQQHSNHPSGQLQTQPPMNNYGGNAQYNRYASGPPPSGFLTSSHPYNTNNTAHPSQQHQQQQQQQPINSNISPPSNQMQQHSNTHIAASHPISTNTQHQQQQQQSMGFPEVQTDTPPQTPPNMKLPSVVGSFITAANQISTTGTCFNNNNNATINNNNLNNNNNNTNANQNNGYRSSSSSPPTHPNGYIGNFTRIPQHSPQQKLQDYSQQNLMSSSPHQDNAAFKPFYKRYVQNRSKKKYEYISNANEIKAFQCSSRFLLNANILRVNMDTFACRLSFTLTIRTKTGTNNNIQIKSTKILIEFFLF